MWITMHLFIFSSWRWASSTWVCLCMIMWVWQNIKALSSCVCACRFEWLLTVCEEWIINESTAEESLEAWGNAGNKPPSVTHFLTHHQETEGGGGCGREEKKWMRQGEKERLGWREAWREMSRKGGIRVGAI